VTPLSGYCLKETTGREPTPGRSEKINQETERRLSTVEARLLQQEQNRKKLKQLEQELTEKQETARPRANAREIRKDSPPERE